MRLTFFGSSIVSAYWNGAATYYRGLLRALAERGHEVVFCEPDAYDRQANRDLREDPPYAKVVVYTTEDERDRLVAGALAGSDWVVKCSGVGLWDAELEGAVALGGGPARTAFWDVDAPATLARMAADPADPFHDQVPRFDVVFTYGGGPPVVRAYQEAGARRCIPVYNALDADTHRPPEPMPEERWGVLFMGNRLPDREARVEEFFLAAADAAPDVAFALGGSGWEDKRIPPNVELLGHVPTAAHNRVNASARLVLNIHRDSMVDTGWSPATRMFEAAGAGACQVTDSWRGIADFFQPGEEVLVAESGADVARLARTIDRPTARAMGRAARARALSSHTYGRRAALVDAVLRGEEPGADALAGALASAGGGPA